MVHSAGNDNKLIDKSTVYPTKQLTSKKALKNFITVGSIGPWGQPARSSNYGNVNVDLFARGMEFIPWSWITNTSNSGGQHGISGGDRGITLIWNYFPELTAVQVKQAVLEGATSFKGKQVSLPMGAYFFR